MNYKKYLIVRESGDHNKRYLTNFGSFRYKSELQGGEEFVAAPHGDAVYLSDKLQNEARQSAKDFKKSLGRAARHYVIYSDFLFDVKEVK